MGKGLLAGTLDGCDAIGGNAAQDGHHLAITVADALELAPHGCHRCRQHPVPERGTIAQCAGFARQNRHIVPGIVDCLVSAKAARMFCHDDPVLPDDDLLGIGMDFDGPSDSCRDHRIPVPQGIDPPDQFLIFVTVEPDEAGL